MTPMIDLAEALSRKPIPWRSLTGDQLEEAAAFADRIGDRALLKKTRTAYRRRLADQRP